MTDATVITADEPSLVIVQDDGSAVVLTEADSTALVFVYDGPAGAAAAQDFGWSLTAPFTSGEAINSPPMRACSYVGALVHSTSGFAASQTLTVKQFRSGVLVASETISVGPGQNDWSVTFGTPLAIQKSDIIQLVMPAPPDTQCEDLGVTMVSA